LVIKCDKDKKDRIGGGDENDSKKIKDRIVLKTKFKLN
jgi:hypothetical protein